MIDPIEVEELRRRLATVERRFHHLFMHAGEALMAFFSSGFITGVNEAFNDLFGTNIEYREIATEDGPLLHSFIHPEDRATIDALLEDQAAGKSLPRGVAVRMIRPDGGATFDCELTFHRQAASRITVMTIRDVTEKLRAARQIQEYAAELEKSHRRLVEAQAQLVHSQKMAALGDLVAGVAHELNTPIGAISSNADIAKRALAVVADALRTSSEAPQRALRAVEILEQTNVITCDATERIARIVRSLRTFARLDEAERKTANLHDGIESTLALLGHELGDEVQIVRAYGELPPIACAHHQLNQVFMNVLVNAVQAIEGAGTITIETELEGEAALVRIRDTGCGIRPEHLPRIFDPGFTTKGVGVGTGLGLAISDRIVREHGGTLEATSIPGEGATFTIRLPCVDVST